MRYADLRKYDISNWNGINTTLFVTGCNFHCVGCWNKDAQDFNYGKPYTKEVEDTLISYAQDSHVTGICLLGGEPLHQDLDIILNLVKRIKKEVGKPIYMWTGFTWEQLMRDNKRKEIITYVTVLIDGQFELDKRDLTLAHKGSTNQREIDVQKSLEEDKVVLWEGI